MGSRKRDSALSLAFPSERWGSGKASHLKALLALAVKEQVFPVGHEAEEIRALWKAARQKVLLDETWLQELLRQSSPSLARSVGKPSEAFGQGRAVLSEALALWTVPLARNPHFTGRDDLLSALAAQLSPQEAGQPAALRRAALTQAQVIKGLGSLNHQKRARTPGALWHFA